ncbi:hypothetical protein BJV78DRAFT_1158414 [Lactifluus subvellereus]|nr:hypothetical protein BJV78DRAFT_1158414 [Lactifluus subvellereus]
MPGDEIGDTSHQRSAACPVKMIPPPMSRPRGHFPNTFETCTRPFPETTGDVLIHFIQAMYQVEGTTEDTGECAPVDTDRGGGVEGVDMPLARAKSHRDAGFLGPLGYIVLCAVRRKTACVEESTQQWQPPNVEWMLAKLSWPQDLNPRQADRMSIVRLLPRAW